MSIYDSYKLSNSTAIPLYEGSAGQESIQVGQYMQGLYDQASQGAGVISSQSQNIPAMLEDQQHVKDLQEKVKTSVDTWSKAKNWEDHLPDVLSLGREYASRAAELAAPLKQYADWKEKVLDNPDLKLNSDQKDLLDRMERSKYKGLQKDAMGKLVGEFKGGRLAKNIDTTAKADEWLKGYVEKQGGTDITVDNGITKYRDAKGWHILDKQTIKNIMDAGRYLDPEYKDYVGQEAAMAGWNYVDKVKSIDQLNNSPLLKAEVENKMKKGMPLKDALAEVVPTQKADAISKMMDEYAYNKYAHNNINTITERSIGDIAKARALKKVEDEGQTVITTDVLDNPANNWDDLNKAQDEGNTSRAAAAQEINISKNVVKRDYESKHGKGSWDKITGDAEETAIADYYKGIKGGDVLYQGLMTARNNYKNATENIRKVQEAKDFIESFVANKLGTDPRLLNADMKKGITNVLKTEYKDDKKIRVLYDGKWREFTGSELAGMIDKGTFEDANRSQTIMPSFLEINATKYRTADGHSLVLQDNAVKNKLDDVVSSQAWAGVDRAKAIREYTKEALSNYSQSTAVVKSANKRLNEGIVNTIRAGEKKLYDAAGNPIAPGSEKDTELQNLINNGDFDYIGTRLENKTGQNSMMKIVIRDKQNKGAAPITAYVGVNGNVNNFSAQEMIKQAMGPDGTIMDRREYAAGVALLDGSPYNKINKTKIGTVAKIEQKIVEDGKVKWVPFGTVTKGGGTKNNPIVVAKQGNEILPLQDMVDVGGWLYRFENDPNYKVTY